jgi:putative heme-binding domain-containing protein
MRLLVLASFALLLSSSNLLAQRPDLVAPTGPLSPAEERKKFVLPEGFEAQLVAAEPDIQKPMQMAFDAKGRIWLNTSHHYPFAAEKGKSTDKLYVLSDFGPDGKAKKIEVFADFLNIPIGILPLPDCKSCIVSSVGEILKLTDSDGDGKCDKKEVLFTGFGTRDTHGMYNSFTLMPDGWVYACHGFSNESTVKGKDGHEVKMQSGHTFRFLTDGCRIEIYTHGQVNPFGMTVDPWFNLYTADCHSRPITQLIPGSYYQSFGKPHDGLGFGPHVTRHDHGSTGLCGVAWYDADHFPDDYKGCVFVGNVVTNRINFDRIEWKGSTPVAKELPDFLVSKDPWFRPVDIKLGFDGALYVTDFYNKIIGHYEVPLTHPERDHDHGRLWRIVWKGEPGASATGGPKTARKDWTKASTDDLLSDLVHPNMSVRMMAGNMLVHRSRGGEEILTTQTLQNLLLDPARASSVAGWLLFADQAAQVERTKYRDLINYAKMQNFARDQHSTLVMRALNSRETWEQEDREVVLDILKSFDAVKLTRVVVESIGMHPHADFVRPLIAVIEEAEAGDTALKHAARIALRNCLRDADGAWKAAPEPTAAGSATVADVALGIAGKQSAAYIAAFLSEASNQTTKLAQSAEHIGRYGEPAHRSAVIERAAKLDRLASFATLHALIRGTQAGDRRLEAEETWKVVEAATQVLGPLSKRDTPPKNIRPHLEALRLLADLPAVSPRGFKFNQDNRPATSLYLSNIAQAKKAPDELRFAAMDAIMRIDPASGEKNLKSLLADPATPLPIRERVAVAFAGSTNREPKLDARDVLKDCPYRSAVAIAVTLAGSKDGGEILLEAVKQGKAPARLLQERLVAERLRAAKVENIDSRIAELTKGLPPPDLKTAIILKQRTERFASAKADKSLGKKVFVQHCAACHKIGDEGGKVGPQLDGIGIRGLERLLEDTLDPNRNVDQAFRARVVNLADGTTKTGLMLRVEGEVVVFADDQGKEFRVPKKDIESNRETALSPMPANVAEIIPEADFFHLIAYLLDQKAKEPAKKNGTGDRKQETEGK